MVEYLVDIEGVAGSVPASPTNYLFTKKSNNYIPYVPGDYCEGVIPDPIPNSEVKSFSADGTLS